MGNGRHPGDRYPLSFVDRQIIGLGPVSVGVLLDHAVSDPSRVGAALAIVGAVSALPGVLLLWSALRPYAECAALMATAIAPEQAEPSWPNSPGPGVTSAPSGRG